MAIPGKKIVNSISSNMRNIVNDVADGVKASRSGISKSEMTQFRQAAEIKQANIINGTDEATNLAKEGRRNQRILRNQERMNNLNTADYGTINVGKDGSAGNFKIKREYIKQRATNAAEKVVAGANMDGGINKLKEFYGQHSKVINGVGIGAGAFIAGNILGGSGNDRG